MTFSICLHSTVRHTPCGNAKNMLLQVLSDSGKIHLHGYAGLLKNFQSANTRTLEHGCAAQTPVKTLEVAYESILKANKPSADKNFFRRFHHVFFVSVRQLNAGGNEVTIGRLLSLETVDVGVDHYLQIRPVLVRKVICLENLTMNITN